MSINQKMYELGSKRSVIREIFEYSKKRASEIGAENVYDFSLGNPSVPAPDCVKEAIVELLNTAEPTLLHGYSSAQGDLGVRTAIANDINERFSVGITPDLLYMTCGAAASLTISLKAVLNKGEEVVAFAPYFTEYKVFTENADGVLVKCDPEEKSFQIDLKHFESLINANTRAIIMNSPNNPSGVVYTEETVKAVCAILEKKQAEFGKEIYLIADEPYRELVYGDVFVPYLMNYYDNTIVCYSYSKSLSLPGERIGYIAVSPKMAKKLDVYLSVCGAGRSLGYVCAPSLFQQVIKKTIGATTDVNIYKENRDILLENLTKFGYTCIQPDGAFYLFVKALEKDANAFAAKAKEYELLVVPCDDFGVEGYVRIAYCVDKQRIINSLPSFQKLAKDYGLN